MKTYGYSAPYSERGKEFVNFFRPGTGSKLRTILNKVNVVINQFPFKRNFTSAWCNNNHRD